MNGKLAGVVENPETNSQDVKLRQKLKAAPGVKFVEFDEFGLDKREGLSQYICTDEKEPDYVIAAPVEMYLKAMNPVGVFRDYDIQAKDVRGDSKYCCYIIVKEVFDCLVDSDQDYDKWEELEDDFVFRGNDNQPALQQKDSEDEEEPSQTPLDEYRLRMAALLPQASSVPAPML